MGLVGALDALFLAYFIIHIPTTLLVDGQSVLPLKYYPQPLLDLLKWHIETNGDHLVSQNPLWFVSMVWCEVLLQLPFFFVASYAFIKKANWIRVPCIIYGAHVCTTLVPILSEILFSSYSGEKRYALFGIYLPYFVVPLLLVARMAAVATPWPAAGGRAGKAKRQ